MKKFETTCLIIKPDGVQKRLIGEIISRIEKTNLTISNIQMFQNTPEAVHNQYAMTERVFERFGDKTIISYKETDWDLIEDFGTDNPIEIGRQVHGWLVEYLTSSPMIKIAVSGENAIQIIRDIVGNTVPSLAGSGTIRGDYSTDSPAQANHQKRVMHNVVHASENVEEAENEVRIYFSELFN